MTVSSFLLLNSSFFIPYTHPFLNSSSEYFVPLHTTPWFVHACAIDLIIVNTIIRVLIG